MSVKVFRGDTWTRAWRLTDGAGSGSTLPATAPTALTNATGAVPAIYLVE